jgi:uncharacterized membrane protein (UPF0182 family)
LAFCPWLLLPFIIFGPVGTRFGGHWLLHEPIGFTGLFLLLFIFIIAFFAILFLITWVRYLEDKLDSSKNYC